MSAHLYRAQLLYNQSRYDMAEQECRQALGESPGHPLAHALLGLCLLQQERYDDAQQETEAAIAAAPDEPYPHYCRSVVLGGRNRLAEAEASAREAVRLDSTDPDYHSRLAATLLEQKKWEESLAAAEVGLQYDADHQVCQNLRSMALQRLGRQDESIAAVDQLLARDPDDAMAHANKGWTHLHQRQPQPALEHFREALRLEPTMEYARAGTVEALKARYWIYRWTLAGFLWMASLSRQAQWGLIIGGYIGYRLLANIARQTPALAPWIVPLLAIYLLLVFQTWFAVPMFNLLLRINRFGRHVLSPDDRAASNWFALCLTVVVTSVVVGLATGYDEALLVALLAGALALPLTTIYHCERGWPRQAMAAATAGLALIGTIWIALEWFEHPSREAFFTLSLLAFVGIQFLANYLASATVEK